MKPRHAAVLALGSLATAACLAPLGAWSSVESLEARVPGFEAGADQTVYEVDPVHSSVVFKIRHNNLSNFYGRFNIIKGEIHFDAENPAESTFAFTVPTASIDTHNADRDGHLKNADFFNSRQFPEITFTSTGVKKVLDNAYEVTGDLTLQGVTRPVTATLTDLTTGKAQDADALGFQADFSIQRSDFGMTKYLAPDNSDNGPVGNTVHLIVSIEAIAG